MGEKNNFNFSKMTLAQSTLSLNYVSESLLLYKSKESPQATLVLLNCCRSTMIHSDDSEVQSQLRVYLVGPSWL